MADEIKTIVRQDSYSVTPEGSQGMVRLNPRGELVIVDQFMQWALDGRVFNASNAVEETAESISFASRTATNVNPALLLNVPSGKTAIPLEVMMDMVEENTSENTAVVFHVDDADRYTSGGGAITPINMRKDDPRVSGCLFKSGSTTIVSPANTDDDTIFSVHIDAEATPMTVVWNAPTVFWSARTSIPPILIGPAALLIYITQAAADSTWQYSVKWAEFDTVEIT